MSEHSPIDNDPSHNPKTSPEQESKGFVSVSELISGITVDNLTPSSDGKFEVSSSPDYLKTMMAMRESQKTASDFAVFVYNSMVNVEPDHPYREALDGFKGSVVVDLGAGMEAWGYLISDKAGARGYVGVEPSHAEGLVERIQDYKSGEYYKTNENHELANIPASVVAEDMLTFLKRLPDNSVSILCSGIDNIIIRDRNYHAAVAAEITRVLDPNGVYIGEMGGGHISPSGPPDLLESKIVRRKHHGLTVFRKKI